MRVCVLAFARARELIGEGISGLDIPSGSTVQDVWNMLVQRVPNLEQLAGSIRVARNGRIVQFTETLHEDDEIALLPPVGGG
jgi:molybdopterin converting factor small subunit